MPPGRGSCKAGGSTSVQPPPTNSEKASRPATISGTCMTMPKAWLSPRPWVFEQIRELPYATMPRMMPTRDVPAPGKASLGHQVATRLSDAALAYGVTSDKKLRPPAEPYRSGCWRADACLGPPVVAAPRSHRVPGWTAAPARQSSPSALRGLDSPRPRPRGRSARVICVHCRTMVGGLPVRSSVLQTEQAKGPKRTRKGLRHLRTLTLPSCLGFFERLRCVNTGVGVCRCR